MAKKKDITEMDLADFIFAFNPVKRAGCPSNITSWGIGPDGCIGVMREEDSGLPTGFSSAMQAEEKIGMCLTRSNLPCAFNKHRAGQIMSACDLDYSFGGIFDLVIYSHGRKYDEFLDALRPASMVSRDNVVAVIGKFDSVSYFIDADGVLRMTYVQPEYGHEDSPNWFTEGLVPFRSYVSDDNGLFLAPSRLSELRKAGMRTRRDEVLVRWLSKYAGCQWSDLVKFVARNREYSDRRRKGRKAHMRLEGRGQAQSLPLGAEYAEGVE